MHFSFLSKCQLREEVGFYETTCYRYVHCTPWYRRFNHLQTIVPSIVWWLQWLCFGRQWHGSYRGSATSLMLHELPVIIILQVVGSILWSAVLCIILCIRGNISSCDSCSYLNAKDSWCKEKLNSESVRIETLNDLAIVTILPAFDLKATWLLSIERN